MSAPAGYTLDQLLSWCLEDRLIDSYEKRKEVIIIVQGDLRHELAVGEAEMFLRAMFRPDLVVKTQRSDGSGGSPLQQKKGRNEA